MNVGSHQYCVFVALSLYTGLCLDISSIFSVFVCDFITKLIPKQHEATHQTKLQQARLVVGFALVCF